MKNVGFLSGFFYICSLKNRPNNRTSDCGRRGLPGGRERDAGDGRLRNGSGEQKSVPQNARKNYWQSGPERTAFLAMLNGRATGCAGGIVLRAGWGMDVGAGYASVDRQCGFCADWVEDAGLWRMGWKRRNGVGWRFEWKIEK